MSTAPLAVSGKIQVERGTGVWRIQTGSDVGPSCGGHKKDLRIALPLMITQETEQSEAVEWGTQA